MNIYLDVNVQLFLLPYMVGAFHGHHQVEYILMKEIIM
jgi:hypothetical protein